MKAIVKHQPGKAFLWQKVVEPQIVKNDDVKLTMVYSGICGTDLHIYQFDQWAEKNIKLPHINGHEGVGKVVAIGKSVTSVKVGDYVSFETHIYCQTCVVCQAGNYHVCKNMKILGVTRDGVWSQFVVLPERIIFPIRGDFPLKYAAILEPFGNAYHTQAYSQLKRKNVLIIGDGPIGLFAGLIAKTRTPQTLFLTGVTPYRRQIALDCGLTYLNPSEVNLKKELEKLTNGKGIDVIIECSGNVQALQEGIELINPGGEINIISLYPQEAISLPLNNMTFKNIRVQLVTGRKIWSTWDASWELLKSGKINQQALDQVISHIFPWEKFELAFQTILQGKTGKVLLKFPT